MILHSVWRASGASFGYSEGGYWKTGGQETLCARSYVAAMNDFGTKNIVWAKRVPAKVEVNEQKRIAQRDFYESKLYKKKFR
jgi:hypothetical protein